MRPAIRPVVDKTSSPASALQQPAAVPRGRGCPRRHPALFQIFIQRESTVMILVIYTPNQWQIVTEICVSVGVGNTALLEN